jgi:hypothetical protein
MARPGDALWRQPARDQSGQRVTDLGWQQRRDQLALHPFPERESAHGLAEERGRDGVR